MKNEQVCQISRDTLLCSTYPGINLFACFIHVFRRQNGVLQWVLVNSLSLDHSGVVHIPVYVIQQRVISRGGEGAQQVYVRIMLNQTWYTRMCLGFPGNIVERNSDRGYRLIYAMIYAQNILNACFNITDWFYYYRKSEIFLMLPTYLVITWFEILPYSLHYSVYNSSNILTIII